MMHSSISLGLAVLFVFLAGFNVWSMLTGRAASPGKLWTRIHRIAGYLFIALFAILCYFMLLRLRGWQDELSPRLIAHMALALSLAPLLVVKVVVARYQKTARGLLIGLGIVIFGFAFTLVALNASVHYLRAAPTKRVPLGTSASVVVVILLSSAAASFGKLRRPKHRLEPAVLSLDKPVSQELRDPRFPLKLTLVRIDSQTNDAKTFRFLLPKRRDIAARPGQFLTFEWTIDNQRLTRSYSICSSPAQTAYVEITAKRVQNGRVSQFLDEHASVGLTVTARGPYGKFYFDEEKHRRIVLIAGGSGVTPMMAMLRYIDDFCIPVDTTLIYCVRTQEDVFFNSELAELSGRLRSFRQVLVLSQPDSDWKGWKGHLRREILEREVKRALESTFFLCGPPAFMALCRNLLKDMGVKPGNILQESFGGAVGGETASVSKPGALTVTFARSAATYNLSIDETVLEGAERNEILMPSGCRQGNCGTCAIKLISGKVQMEGQDALDDDLRSQGYILPCVSRPLGNLTLDA